MDKKVLIIFFTLFLLFGCKKSEVLTQENQDDIKIAANGEYDDSRVEELISALGGKLVKNRPLFDAGIKDLKGRVSNLSDYKGKVIFLNLWATWCPPCRGEMPTIEALYNEFRGKDFQIIAVSQGESEETVKKFLTDFNYTFPIFIDNKGQVAKSYNSGAIPTTYIIDKKGDIIAQIVGGRDWASAEVKELIEELL